MQSAELDQLIHTTISGLPPPFSAWLTNVLVDVEEWPEPELLLDLGMAKDDSLYGVYDGVPLTERSVGDALTQPDRIVIFSGPLLRDLGHDPAELRHQIRHTVLHEVGHHFGLSDERMIELDIY